MVENVPFYPQEDFQCGPSSLATVLNYYGMRETPNQIAEDIFSKSARGTLTVDMVIYAQRKGLQALQFKGDIKHIKKNIDSGIPVIVLVDYGFSLYQANHFMVIVGYSGDGVIANSGRSKEKLIEWNDFLKTWEKAGFWMLVIRLQPRQAKT